MRIRFVEGADGRPGRELRQRLERRVRLVVGRRAPGISTVEIAIDRVAAARPGTDDAAHRCRIRARLASGVRLEVEEQGARLEHAIDVAAWRLDRQLERQERMVRVAGDPYRRTP